MRRFFIAGELSDAPALSESDFNHVKNVLRLKPGDLISVADRFGHTAVAEIESLSGKEARLAVRQVLAPKSDPKLKIILGQGLTKGDKMDFICQKATELGVSAIAPLVLEHSVARYDAAKARLKQERWQKIVLAAGKQCWRDLLPSVYPPMTLPQALANFTFDLGIIAWEKEAERGIRAVLRGVARPVGVFLLIGPEGGFSTAEIEAAAAAGFQRASLGPRILRAETAALAALSVIMYEFGDLGEENA
jgi:16S rRNA (uracil1498-N3)-methyltransferase